MRERQGWEWGQPIELSGPVTESGWQMPPPIPKVSIREVDLTALCRRLGLEFTTYTQAVTMCVQAGTYLETGAHLYPRMEAVSDVGLKRLFVSALVLQLPRRKDEKVTARDMQAALRAAGESLRPGDAVIVGTGFDAWTQPADDSPHFSYDAVEWVVRRKAGILGSDMAAFHDGVEKPNFFPMFLKSGTLLLAPLTNLRRITQVRIPLAVLPTRIEGACAAPTRVIGFLPAARSSHRGMRREKRY